MGPGPTSSDRPTTPRPGISMSGSPDVGENVRENMNEIGFIRDDNRREVDSNIKKQFWINRHGLQDLTPSVNYNRFWSQDGDCGVGMSAAMSA